MQWIAWFTEKAKQKEGIDEYTDQIQQSQRVVYNRTFITFLILQNRIEMRKNNVVLALMVISVLFSLINLTASQTLQEKGIQSELDERVRMLFGEKSALSNFQHLINGYQYQYILSYESGLSVTFTLTEKNIFVTKSNANFPTTPIKPPTQSQSSITQNLISIKEITPDYILKFFAVLSDGYLVQYQYQETLVTFQLNWNLQIKRKQIKDLASMQISQSNLSGIDAFLVPISAIQKNNANSDITSPLLTQSTVSQSRSLAATNSVPLQQTTINQITQFLHKSGLINLSSNTKISNISKIGNTNRYLIDMIVTIKQREIPYQLIIRNGSKGYEILGGSFSIDFTPSYQQVFYGNQALNKWMDELIRTKLQLIMPAEVQLTNIWQDDPYYKLNYTTVNADYEIQFIVDSMLKKVNITSIIVTQDLTENVVNQNLINTDIPLSFDSNSNLDILGSSINTNSQLYSSPTNISNAALTPVNIPESFLTTKSYPSEFSIYLTQDCNEQPYNIVHVSHRFRNRTRNGNNSNINSVDETKTALDIVAGQTDQTQISAQPSRNLLATSTPTSLNTADYNIQNMVISPADITPTLSLSDIMNPPTQSTTQSQSNNISLYDTFDASLLPINLQVVSQLVPYTKQQILSVLAYLQGTATFVSFSNAKIYIIQKFEYGFRIVFLINFQYLQFIINSTSTNSYTVINIRNVTQQQADSVNTFFQFFPINLDSGLQSILMKALTQSNIGTIKSISNIQLRIYADGLYYIIVVSTDSGNLYFVTIYYKPEQSFSEVLSYQQISSQYYMADKDLVKFNESRIDLAVKGQWNLQLLSVLDFVNLKFGQQISSYGVVYVYKTAITTLNVMRYRIGFESENGVYYEVIAIFVNSSTSPILLKYAKLYDGYGLVSPYNLDVKPVIILFESILQQRIRQININDYQTQNILMKEIPLFGKLYKLVLSAKLNIEITIFVNMQGIIFIYGIDGRPDYYSILISLNYTSFGYLTTIIQNIRTQLMSQTKPSPQVTTGTNQFSSGTTQQSLSQTYSTFPTLKFNFSSNITPSASTYNARMDLFCLKSDGSICISCYYRYYPLNGKCVPVPTPCLTYNNITGECLSCYTGYYLSNSNCTQMNLLCQQSDSNGGCIKCYSDYTPLNNLCYSTKGIASALLNNLPISSYDPLCEQYQNKVCSKCVFGAYMSSKYKGCVIQDPNALQFDPINQVAITCVRGYVISDVGVCVKTI